MLHNVGDYATGCRENGSGRSTGNFGLHSLGRTIELTHFQLSNTAVTVASVVNALLVVVSIVNTITRKLPTIVVTLVIAHLTPPFLNNLENHMACFTNAILTHASLGGMVKDTINETIAETVDINVIIVNGLHQLRNGPSDSLGSTSTSNFVQDLGKLALQSPHGYIAGLSYVGKMILGEHGVGRVGTVLIVENNMLLVLTALDNLFGASLELVANLSNQRNNEWSNDGEDKLGELLFKLLDNLGQYGDIVDGIANSLHDVIVKLDGWHDLRINILDVQGEFLGISWGDGSVLHLGCIGVFLDLVDFLLFLPATKDAIGNLVKEFAEETSIGLLAFLKCSFELLDLVLGQLVGHWAGLVCITDHGRPGN